MNIHGVGKDPKTLSGPAPVRKRKLLYFSLKSWEKKDPPSSQWDNLLTGFWPQSPPPASVTSTSTFHPNHGASFQPPNKPPASRLQVFHPLRPPARSTSLCFLRPTFIEGSGCTVSENLSSSLFPTTPPHLESVSVGGSSFSPCLQLGFA